MTAFELMMAMIEVMEGGRNPEVRLAVDQSTHAIMATAVGVNKKTGESEVLLCELDALRKIEGLQQQRAAEAADAAIKKAAQPEKGKQ